MDSKAAVASSSRSHGVLCTIAPTNRSSDSDTRIAPGSAIGGPPLSVGGFDHPTIGEGIRSILWGVLDHVISVRPGGVGRGLEARIRPRQSDKHITVAVFASDLPHRAVRRPLSSAGVALAASVLNVAEPFPHDIDENANNEPERLFFRSGHRGGGAPTRPVTQSRGGSGLPGGAALGG